MTRMRRPVARARWRPAPRGPVVNLRPRPAAPDRGGPPAGPGPEARPILVVDDDNFGRETLSQILEAAGYHVRRAADGEQALRCLDQSPLPGLIVLDLLMPQTDGWQFCAQKRRDPRQAGVPILVVSAADTAALCGEFEGIVGRFEKPVVVPELLAAIRRYCRPG